MVKEKPESSRSGRFISPEDAAKASGRGIDSSLLAQAQENGQKGHAKSESDGWRIVFAGDRRTIDQLADRDLLCENNPDVSPGSYFGFYESLDKAILKAICGEIKDNYQANSHDAVVTTDAEFVRALPKDYSFEEDFDIPIIIVSPTAAEDVRAIGKPNIYSIDTIGKDPEQLRTQLRETITKGKEFVDKVNKSAILLMVNNPDDYSNLQKRDPDKVWRLRPTEKAYELAKIYLTSKDPLVGAVVVDALNYWQKMLLAKAQGETEHSDILTVYVGTDHPPELDKYFKGCIVQQGGEIATYGLRRVIVAHFNPNTKKQKATDTQVIMLHDEYIGKEGHRSIVAEFEESETPKISNGYEVPGKRKDSRRARFVV